MEETIRFWNAGIFTTLGHGHTPHWEVYVNDEFNPHATMCQQLPASGCMLYMIYI